MADFDFSSHQQRYTTPSSSSYNNNTSSSYNNAGAASFSHGGGNNGAYNTTNGAYDSQPAGYDPRLAADTADTQVRATIIMYYIVVHWRYDNITPLLLHAASLP